MMLPSGTEFVDLNQVLEKETDNLKNSIEETKAVVTHDELPKSGGTRRIFYRFFRISLVTRSSTVRLVRRVSI